MWQCRMAGFASLCGVVLALSGSCMAVPLPGLTVDEAQAKLLAAWEKVDSVRAAMSIESRMRDRASGEAGGEMQYVRDGAYGRYRMRYLMHLSNEMRDVEQEMETLFDGGLLYTTTRYGAQVRVVEAAPSLLLGVPPPGGPLLFEVMRQILKLVGVEEGACEGRPVYVIRGEPPGNRPEIANPMQRGRFFFDKETGMCLRMELGTKEKNVYMTLSYTEVVMNPEMDPTDFIFAMPPNAEFQSHVTATKQESAATPTPPKAAQSPSAAP